MSETRIRTTHAGALPRSSELQRLVFARAQREAVDAGALKTLLRTEVADVVRRQVELGIDSVNDGELGKTNFTNYVRERLAGFEMRPAAANDPPPLSIAGRDLRKFPEYFASGGRGFGAFVAAGPSRRQVYCTEPLRYVGHAALEEDIDHFRAALGTAPAVEAYLPANTPGTIEHWLRNDFYRTEEELVFAIAEAMREEYEGIVAAGFLLQIDDPDLADGWQMYPDMSVEDYRRYATMRIEALNHALRNIPREKIRLHVCWGSFHGPHEHDLPLADLIDLIFRVKASSYSIEASNPRHEHEWQVFQNTALPDDAVLIPGVVGHCTDFIEHPELVADRLMRYADLVGRERLMAGTDCGLGPRVGHAKIAWAKLGALAEGAKIASDRLWARGR